MVWMMTMTQERPDRNLRPGQPAETTWQEWMYRLVICPEGEGAERIRQLTEADGQPDRTQNLPCIPIAAFRGREAMEDTLIRWVQRVCRMHQRFQVILDDPQPHPAGGWRLPVTDTEPIRQLSEKLTIVDEYIRSCRLGPVHWETNHACRFNGTPEMTDRRPQTPRPTNNAFATFLVHSLVLTRQAYADGPVEIVNLFAFLP